MKSYNIQNYIRWKDDIGYKIFKLPKVVDGDYTIWNDTAPSTTVFSVDGSSGTNGSSETYVHYVFAPVQGYSKFGRYLGAGSTDGTFVYTGFRPAFLWIEDYDSSNSWRTYDAKNDPYNPSSHWMVLDDNSARNTSDTTSDIDFLSNGFKIRGDASTINGTDGNKYVYMAWGSDPFKYGVAR